MAVTRERKLEVAERSYQLLTEKYGIAAGGHLLRPAGLPLRHRRRAVHRLRGRDHRGHARSSRQRFPDTKTILGISNVSFGLPDGRARGAELGLPLPLRAGGPRPRASSTPRSSSATRRSRRRSGASPRTCSSCAGRRADPVARRSPPTSASAGKTRREAGARRAAARRAPRALHRRGLARTGSSTTSTAALADPRWPAARDHQRPADEGHGRGRAALQRQRADRRRGAAERRGDEGRGRLPRAASWRRPTARRLARQGAARHGQGRRPRHRQEPGRDHPRQQRLPGRQPRHQGAARAADRRRSASTGRTSSGSPACW